MMQLSEKLETIIQNLRHALGLVYGDRLSRLILFGSQARMDAERYSDIDIALVFNGEVEPTQETSTIGEVTASMSLEHDVVISCFCLTEDRFLSEDSPFLRNIRREGIVF